MARYKGQAGLAPGARRRRRQLTGLSERRRVADAMVTCPTVHGPSMTLGEVRAFFCDAHVHAAVLVDGGTLIGIVERADLAADLVDGTHAWTIAVLDGRTVHPGEGAPATRDAMKRDGRRRLAVVDEDGKLLGLLCLKASGLGFCSDDDVSSRRPRAAIQ